MYEALGRSAIRSDTNVLLQADKALDPLAAPHTAIIVSKEAIMHWALAHSLQEKYPAAQAEGAAAAGGSARPYSCDNPAAFVCSRPRSYAQAHPQTKEH